MSWHFPLDAESCAVQCIQYDIERWPHLAWFSESCSERHHAGSEAGNQEQELEQDAWD